MPGADVCDWTGRGLDGRTGGRWRNIRARCARMRCSGGTPARPGGRRTARSATAADSQNWLRRLSARYQDWS